MLSLSCFRSFCRVTCKRLPDYRLRTYCRLRKITPSDEHSQQAELKWQVATNITSNRAAFPWQPCSVEKWDGFSIKRHQRMINFYLLKMEINWTEVCYLTILYSALWGWEGWGSTHPSLSGSVGEICFLIKKKKANIYEQISKRLHAQTEKKNSTIDKVHSHDRVRGGKQEEMKEV